MIKVLARCNSQNFY